MFQTKSAPNYKSHSFREGGLRFAFRLPLNTEQRDQLKNLLKTEHSDYVGEVTWLLPSGDLKVSLRPPRRDIDPSSRRDGRIDIPRIVTQFCDSLKWY